MDNLNNRSNIMNNYFNPLVNDYSAKETSSLLIKGNRYNNLSIKQSNPIQNNYLTNNFKKLNSNDILNNRIMSHNNFKRFPTQQNLKQLNIHKNHNIHKKANYITMPDDYNVTFAKKSNMYQNYNGKVNNINNFKNVDINNNSIVKKLNNKYNPKYYSSTNNNVLINNNNVLVDNNSIIITKKTSSNLPKYNNNLDLNSTLPTKTINKNYFVNEILSTEQKLSLNQKMNKKKFMNGIILNSENKSQKKSIKTNLVSMTDYKIKNRNQKNDLSFDYGIMTKGQKFNFFKNDNPQNNNFNNYNMLSNYLSERKNKFSDIHKNKNMHDKNDDIDDSDLDEIVDELDLFFNNEKQNKTVILNEKGFSDDSLSDIAGDIVKNFQDFENENESDNINIPSAFNPELDGITSGKGNMPYNNDYQESQRENDRNKIIYETKSTVKPTIVNNFFISSASGEQNKNNNLNKDINYNLFVVNEYNNNNSNNKINNNSNIPALVAHTYKSPNILREEKNNQKQKNINNNIDNNQFSELFIDNKNEEIINRNKNQNINQNIIIDFNYSNNINNNTLIAPNINNEINNINNQFNTTNINEQKKRNNLGDNINIPHKSNTIENDYQYMNNNMNNIKTFKDFNNNKNNNMNNIKTFTDFNNNKINNNNQIYNLNNQNYSINNVIKKNSNELKYTDSTIKDLLSSSNNIYNHNNNNKSYKEPNKRFNKVAMNDIDNKNLLINKIKNKKNNIINNNIINNVSANNINNNYLNNNNINKNLDINNSNITQINPNNYLNNNLSKSNILTKNKKHISFNLNNNVYIKFRKDDLITSSQITTTSGEVYNHFEKNMNLYKNELKMIKPKPIIKTFLAKDIKINQNYILVENLPERQILPELYDDFEEDDIKSLEKSLERSVDKILH